MGGGGHLYLSAEQFHDHDGEPSWKAPPEERGIGIVALIVIFVALAIAIWISLRVLGVI